MSVRTKDRILKYLGSHPGAGGKALREHLGVSRQALSVHLRDLVREEKIVKSGSTRGASYQLAGSQPQPRKASRRAVLEGLDESLVYDELATRLNLGSELRGNVRALVRYGFTEMLNNAIDHSKAETCNVSLEIDSAKVAFDVKDRGVGAFHSIASKFSLPDEEAAMIELLKGKTTTAPERHTGEGIFFTARAADELTLRSHRLQLEWSKSRDDVFVSERRHIEGTHVSVTLFHATRRRLEDVFREFAPADYDYEFQKTRILIRLLRRDYVSRSEAKRLLTNLDKFREVRLDFRDVQSVGQGFADEVFRVFAREHPDVLFVPARASPAVLAMLRHVGYAGAGEH